MYNEWTMEGMEKLAREVCAKQGIKFDIPIILNNRTTTVLGSCVYDIGAWSNGGRMLIPCRIEISKKLFDNGSNNDIKSVLLHEVAHFIATKETKRNMYHGQYFKNVCKRIGIANDGVSTTLENNIIKDYKYHIVCDCCGKILAKKTRACNMTKYPHRFKSTCCSGKIKSIQNY